MATVTLEQRIEKLEAANKKLEREMTRVNAILEIQNLLGKYEHHHTENRDSETSYLYAKREDTRVGGSTGYFEGPDAIDRFIQRLTVNGKPPAGHMPLHLLANGIIEVAKDGKTARGIWYASGMVAFPKDSATGKPSAIWEYNRYGFDFIKENGKWKIWHQTICPLFQIGWNQSWEARFGENKEDAVQEYVKNLFNPNPPKADHVLTRTGYNPANDLTHLPEPEAYEFFEPKTMQ